MDDKVQNVIRAQLEEAAKEDRWLTMRNAPFLSQLKLFVGAEQECKAHSLNLHTPAYERYVMEDEHEREGWIPDPNGTEGAKLRDRGGSGDPGVPAIKIRAGKMLSEVVTGVKFRLVDRVSGETVWSNE